VPCKAPDSRLDGVFRRDSTWYGGGHEILIVGYGKSGTDAEGIWIIKNSHGLNSGFDGYVYITENLISLSFPAVWTAELMDDTYSDLDRFAATMKNAMAP